MKKLIVLVMLIMSSSVYAENKHGLGFAIGTGFGAFYDYNLDSSQIHSSLLSSSETQQSLFGTSKIEMTQSVISITYRLFMDKPGDAGGWFVGAGGGSATTEMTYTVTSLSGTTQSFYKVQGTGIVALIDLGWQGSDGYYFTINYSPTSFITYDEKDSDGNEFEETDIPDVSNHRATATDMWARSKDLSSFSLGFGWFF